MNKVKLNTIPMNYSNTDYVYLDDTFLLLFPHSILSKELRQSIIAAGINNVFSEGSFEQNVNIQVTQALSSEEKNALDIAKGHIYLKQKLQEYYNQIYRMLEVTRILDKQSFSFEPINNFIYEEIYHEVKKNAYLYLLAHNIQLDDANPYILLGVKNMIFTIAYFEVSEKKLITNVTSIIEMSIASLFLDLGVLLIISTFESANRQTTINIKNPKFIKVISRITGNILRRSFVPPIIISTVEEVHKSFQDIHFDPSPRIVDLVRYTLIINTYGFLLANLPSKEGSIPFQALQVMIANNKKMFSHTYLTEFVNTVGYIPPGSYVELNNKSKCFVVRNQPANLKTPLVQVLAGVDDNPKKSLIIISTEPKEFNIKRVLSKEEYKQLEIIRLHIH